MTFVRRKLISGTAYLYRVKSVRRGDKVMQKVVKYLGREVRRVHGNTTLLVGQLGRKEKKELTRIKNARDSSLRDRAFIVLLSSERKTAKEIAAKLGMGYLSVRHWIQRFNEGGIAGLKSGKARGAEPKFTEEQRAKIAEAVMTEPKKLGLHFSTWSLPKLQRYAVSTGIVQSVSVESVRRILRSEGVRIRKSRRWQYSNDPDFAKKNSL